MTSPLHAAHYADQATQATVEIVENCQIACDTFRLRIACEELARRITPGQFVMVRLSSFDDPLLGRPFALYDIYVDTSGKPAGIDVVYIVQGKLTSRLATFVPGQQVDVWGPLGNGFLPRPAKHLIMVAGGIGQTPFLSLAKESLGKQVFGLPENERKTFLAERITFCYGARSAEYLAGVEDFKRLGIEVKIATDDGSEGHHGLVTDLLRETLTEETESRRLVCCGPEPMMEAVARIAAEEETPCQVSLETPMACGIGICYSCVTKVKEPDGRWDYRRTCVEGPVFDAKKIVW